MPIIILRDCTQHYVHIIILRDYALQYVRHIITLRDQTLQYVHIIITHQMHSIAHRTHQQKLWLEGASLQ